MDAVTLLLMHAGDTLPAITDSLSVDLTGATVELILVQFGIEASYVATAVDDPTLGNVEYQWIPGDTDLLRGSYAIQWKIAFQDGNVKTFAGADSLFVAVAM